jgi:surface protein
MRLRRNTILNALPILVPPEDITAEVDGSDIIITIGTEAASVDGYHYYQSIDDGEWSKLNVTATTDLTYTLTPTEPGEYNFRVTSVKGDDESDPSEETTTITITLSEFIIEVKTDNTGTSADDQIMLPIQGTSMVIDWGDGNSETVTQTNNPNHTLVGGDNVVHTYDSAGTYEIKISDAITRVYFNDGGDKAKLTEIKNWGDAVWGTGIWEGFLRSFKGCSNLAAVSATDAPTIKTGADPVTSFNSLFYDCSSLSSFPSLNSFPVTSAITNISSMLRNTAVNADVSNWDTSNVTGFDSAFRENTAFKQDISAWDFISATVLDWFLLGADINETGTTTNYDALLNSIASQTVNNSLTFHGGNSEYSSAGETSRWELIAVHDSANADASGTDKSVADGEEAGYQYWDTSEEKLYIKKSATSADWIGPLDLGKSWTITDGGLA